MKEPRLNCATCHERRDKGEIKKLQCHIGVCHASHLMHPELSDWISLFFLACGFENQELQLYRMAGARGYDLEVFVMLRGVFMEYQSAKAKADAARAGR